MHRCCTDTNYNRKVNPLRHWRQRKNSPFSLLCRSGTVRHSYGMATTLLKPIFRKHFPVPRTEGNDNDDDHELTISRRRVRLSIRSFPHFTAVSAWRWSLGTRRICCNMLCNNNKRAIVLSAVGSDDNRKHILSMARGIIIKYRFAGEAFRPLVRA